MAVTQGVLRVDCDPYGDTRDDLCSSAPLPASTPPTTQEGLVARDYNLPVVVDVG